VTASLLPASSAEPGYRRDRRERRQVDGPPAAWGLSFQAFQAIVNELHRHQKPGPMLDSVLRLVVDTLGLAAGWVFLRLEPEGCFLASSYRIPSELAADDCPGLKRGPCRCQRRLLAGQMVKSTNWMPWERLELAGMPGSHLSVPIYAGDRILGLMNLTAAGRQPPPAVPTELLDLVGALVGLALERVLTLSGAEATRQRERDEVSELARVLLNVATVDDLGRALFPVLRRTLEADALSLLVVDPSGTCLTLAAGWGWPEAHVGRLQLPLSPPKAVGRPGPSTPVSRPFATSTALSGPFSSPSLSAGPESGRASCCRC